MHVDEDAALDVPSPHLAHSLSASVSLRLWSRYVPAGQLTHGLSVGETSSLASKRDPGGHTLQRSRPLTSANVRLGQGLQCVLWEKGGDEVFASQIECATAAAAAAAATTVAATAARLSEITYLPTVSAAPLYVPGRHVFEGVGVGAGAGVGVEGGVGVVGGVGAGVLQPKTVMAPGLLQLPSGHGMSFLPGR